MQNNLLKKEKIIILSIIIIVLIILIITKFAVAKYVEKLESNMSSEVAKPICSLNIIERSNDTVNPYCDVEICNYDENGNVSQITMNFSIGVNLANGNKIDNYYWEDSNGNNIGKSLAGNFETIDKTKKTYRIYFLNLGEEDKIENIEFSLNAVQTIKK